MRLAALALLAAAAAVAVAEDAPAVAVAEDAPYYVVTSFDGSTSLTIDGASGDVIRVTVPSGNQYSVFARVNPNGMDLFIGSTTVTSPDGETVVVTRTFSDGTHTTLFTDTFRPAALTVGWDTVAVETGPVAWSTGLDLNVSLVPSGLDDWRFWLPTAGGCEANGMVCYNYPLSHCSSGSDWQSCMAANPLPPRTDWPLANASGPTAYRYGNLEGGADLYWRMGSIYNNTVTDSYHLPVVSFLRGAVAVAAGLDDGFSLITSPDDAPLELFTLLYAGPSATVTRLRHRLAPRVPLKLTQHIGGHAGDWRPGVGAALATYPDYFYPPNPAARAMGGTGAYSPLAVNWSDPSLLLQEMGYTVNWDLSGRFMPYDGVYIPPVVSRNETWNNDPDGGQPLITPSIESIEQVYGDTRAGGYFDLSYIDFNNFGLNMAWPVNMSACGNGSVAPGQEDRRWLNPNCFFAQAFNASLLLATWMEDQGFASGPTYSWQNSLNVDSAEPSFLAQMVAQTGTRVSNISTFMGQCVDRSDYMDYYRLDLAPSDGTYVTNDDSVSWVPVGPGGSAARSMRVSFMQTSAAVHALLHPSAPVPGRGLNGSYAFFLNVFGNARTDIAKYYDGIFSEGPFLNAIAFQGLRRPAIEWLYDVNVSSPAAGEAFFQGHLLRGTWPMAPFPGNDHSILPGHGMEAWHVRYGGLLASMRGRDWYLAPHAARVLGGEAVASVNAFVEPDGAFLFPVVGAANTTASVTLVLTNLAALPAIPLHDAWTPRDVWIARDVTSLRAHASPADLGAVTCAVAYPRPMAAVRDVVAAAAAGTYRGGFATVDWVPLDVAPWRTPRRRSAAGGDDGALDAPALLRDAANVTVPLPAGAAGCALVRCTLN